MKDLPKTLPTFKHTYTNESRIADPQTAENLINHMLDVVIPNVTAHNILSLSGDAHKAIVECLRITRIPADPNLKATAQLMHEKMDAFKVFLNKFLWEEEKKLVAEVLKVNEKGNHACARTHRFQKTIPVLPAIHEKFIKLVKKKGTVGTYEPSMSSYHSQILAFRKPDGKNVLKLYIIGVVNLTVEVDAKYIKGMINN
ncbi:hypothetical protein M413DRAFT_23584 [Hebeloma cylindrosporum]|uniref:Uncharacterized protein n=1 Tax=Hebeloma cylindrosporum TaxID=76867 RepID=A0A0C3CPJ7_HEBCY|nr:hypothetical protein M413DRAFT_23584 [Hebeloma cylindrosporum h7]